MSCDPIRARISGYLDDELGVADAETVRAHLPGCSECRAELESLRALKHAIARLPGTEEPPGAIRAHVEAMRFDPPRLRYRRFIVASAAAAVILLAFYIGRVQQPARQLTDDLVADHLHSVPEVRPAEVTSHDPKVIAAFFAGHLPFDAVVPRLSHANLIGGRLCKLDGRRVQLLFYNHAGQTLSLFVTDQQQPNDGCESARGHSVCRRRQGDLTLFLVGVLPQAGLQSLLAEASF